MSRSRRLEELERRLPDLSAEELRTELAFWREHARKLRGPALKLGLKFLHRLERALEMKSRQEGD